jgi:hypothetical protein
MRATPALTSMLLLAILPGCRSDAQIHGTVTQAGKGVPGVTIALECPDGSKRTTTTNATGDFRFEDLGPGVDERCNVQTTGAATWASQSVATRCAQHDAKTGLCTEAVFAFAQ